MKHKYYCDICGRDIEIEGEGVCVYCRHNKKGAADRMEEIKKVNKNG